MNPSFNLDVSTIFLVMVIITMTIGITLLVSMRTRSQLGLNYFTAFYLMQPFVLLLFLLIGSLPDEITIPAANSLLSFAYSLSYIGYCKFFNRKINWWFVFLPVLLTFICFTVFLKNFPALVICAGIISGAQFLITFLVIFSIKERAVQRSKPILLTAYAVIGFIFLIRTVHMMIYPGSYSNLFDPFWINSALLIVSIIINILIALGILFMVTDRLLEENIDLATHDYLTHLCNRRLFTDLATRELARAERYSRETSILMIDIDLFKQINDTYGHSVGDKVLVDLAQIFQNSLRKQDICCRYGGDEFCILLAETSTENTLLFAERLHRLISSNNRKVENLAIQYTVSIGVVTATGGQTPTLKALINGADIALYKAKEAGRDCTRMVTLSPEV